MKKRITYLIRSATNAIIYIRSSYKILTVIAFLCFLLKSNAQYTAIPDANFETALAAYDDIAGDQQIPTNNISSITALDVSNKNISDLTGIKDFLALQSLNCSDNNLTSLDLQFNVALTSVNAKGNNLAYFYGENLELLENLILYENDLTSLDVSEMLALKEIDIYSNQITTLDFTKNINIQKLFIDTNDLQTIDLRNGNNVIITDIDISNNPNLTCVLVDDVDYSNNNWNTSNTNTFFSEQYCEYTAIPDTAFEAYLETIITDDISGDGQVPTTLIEAITTLQFSNLNIADLSGIESFVNLENLDIANGTFTTIDLTNNTLLQNLLITNTNVAHLDLSANNQLQTVGITNNTDITTINLNNGNNTNITTINISGNTLLDCIKVDDIDHATNNWGNVQSVTYSNVDCGYIDIPDANFEAALEDLGYDDISGDGLIPENLIENISQLILNNRNISDITGIEHFTELVYLSVFNNNLSAIDVSNNLKLTYLDVSSNDLNDLDVSMLTDLDSLDLSNNAISSIDLSNNTSLTRVLCTNNQFANLDLTGLVNLEYLNCQNNNNLSSLIFTGVVNLTEIYAGFCDLNAIDVSAMPNLDNIWVNNNNISQIDLSNNPVLTDVFINDNNLTTVDLRNGNNQIIDSFNSEKNDDLTCIAVNDIGYAASQFEVDDHTTFTTDCNTYSYIKDINFENALYALGLDDIQNDNQIPTNNIELLQSLDVSNANINDLKGIESFISLVTLNVSNNNLQTIDLSKNILLENLNIEDNQLGVLNLSFLPNLVNLNASGNQLFSLNVQNGNNNNFISFDATNNTELVCVLVDDDSNVPSIFTNNVDVQTSFSHTNCTIYTAIPDANFESALWDLGYDDIAGDGQVPKDMIHEITSLEIYRENITNLSGIEDFTLLETLACYNNLITTVDLSQNTKLKELNISNNELTTLDLSVNIALEEVTCYSNNLNDINVAGLTNLTYLESYGNQLNAIDISSNIALEYLDLGNNDLTILDVSNNGNLKNLRVYNNSFLTNIDLSNNVELEYLNLNECRFSNIDLSLNTKLVELDLSGNFLSLIDLTNNTLLIDLDLEDNDLIAIDLSKNTALEEVNMGENKFTSLHFPDNINLRDIDVEENSLLTKISFGTLPNIEKIVADDCIISSIDVSHLSNLKKIDIRDNQLTYLDLSNNSALTTIVVNRNKLTYLNIKNGNNANVTSLLATNNDDLRCIIVDDLQSTANWTNIDAGVTFSTTTCGYVLVPDANFETALDALGYDDIANDGKIPVALIENITYLNVANKNITDATGIEGFKALDDLYIHDNNLTNLDIDRNNALKFLFCQNNNLEALDITSNKVLEVVGVQNNNLTSIDVSNNTVLKTLFISDNPIARVDVLKNPLLIDFQANNTNLVYMDFTMNTALEEIEIENTPIVSLNLKNGNISNISDVKLINNPNLICVSVDDVNYAMNNWMDISDFSMFTTTACTFTTYTTIPDSYFEERLYNLGYDDILGDNQVPTLLIESITSLDLSQSGITDITGIEDFTSLEVLRINSTSISDLDLSGNSTIKELYAYHSISGTLNLTNMTALEYLECYETSVNNLILTGATALKEMQVYRTNFTDLDISTNTALEKLVCYESRLANINTTGAINIKELIIYRNDIEDLDISTNIALEKVECYEQNLKTINTSGVATLKELYVQRTSLTSIDVLSNIGLTTLHCYDNAGITVFDISTLSLLEDLDVSGCDIATLDLSSNPNLKDINVRYNDLISLDLRNGNNVNITSFDATENTDLNCIKVDDIDHAERSFVNIDSGTLFTTASCGYTLIPDPNFEAALAFADDIPGDGKVPTAKLEVVNIVRLDGKSISDLTGIEDFTNMESLLCRNNNLTSLDVSNNANLVSLSLDNNGFNSIDISSNVNLKSLSISGNNLTTIDLSNNIVLENLSIDRNNNLTSLDVSQNTVLKNLSAYDCSLSQIDLSNNTGIIEIYLDQNELTNLDLSNNSLLEDLYISFNLIDTLDLSGLTNLEEFYAEGCALEELNIKNGNNASITYFDTTNNPNLTCVLVDNVSDVNGNWYYDVQTSFNEVSCDTIDPIAVCQNITIQLDNTGNASITAQDIDNGSTDNGTIVSWVIDNDTFDCSHIGDNTVILTITDTGGNSDSCTAIVTVEDNIAPEFNTATLPTDIDVAFNNSNDDAYILEDFVNNITYTDNCDVVGVGVIITQDPIAGTELIQGDHIISVTITDDYGNDEVHTFTITVNPTLSIEDNVIQDVLIYPNPTHNMLNINVEVEQMVFYNLRGQKIMETTVNKADISHFESGVYFVHITTQKGRMVKQIIKN
ncbi:T9SS type A sorting domain-containing protein [Aquimarina rhabdastrellae]